MNKEDFSRYTTEQLRVEWHKERQIIEGAQVRQEAICEEVLKRTDAVKPGVR